MSRLIIILVSIVIATVASAQEAKTIIGDGDAAQPNTTLQAADTPLQPIDTPLQAIDTLRLPTLDMQGRATPFHLHPLYYGTWNTWQLHPGLNVSAGASVFAQFGKNARDGVGFSQNISAMYAIPVNNKLSVALGGYFNNIFWAHDTYRDAGLSVVAGYKFDDHWEAYLYGHKSIANNRVMPYSLYDMHAVGDRVGAALKYNFNNSTSIQISVESVSMPKRRTLSIEPPATPQQR